MGQASRRAETDAAVSGDGNVLGPGEFERHDDTVRLADPDPGWADDYAREEERLLAALGDRVVRVAHVGSTSVPGLVAKPVIDIVLEVPDAADEDSWVPPLVAAGYCLRRREPDWFEHRLLRPADDPRDASASDGGTGPRAAAVNLHVFPADCREVDRMLAFRDRLRTSPPDRHRYATTKRRLAARTWPTVQDYADAKSEVVAAILARSGVDPA